GDLSFREEHERRRGAAPGVPAHAGDARRGVGEPCARPAFRRQVPGAHPRVDRGKGNGARGRARAHRRRVRAPPAARHAAADRPDRDLRHRRGIRRQSHARPPAHGHAVQHLPAQQPAADADRDARPGRHSRGAEPGARRGAVLRRHRPRRRQSQVLGDQGGARRRGPRIPGAPAPGPQGFEAVTAGRFITIEGGEGVGKSTNLAYVRDLVASRGIEVVATREPGGTPAAERIRELLLEHGDEPLPPVAELLLFFAARSLHVENVIRPALARGAWVVCDRFTDTTRAYQGSGRGLDSGLIEQLAACVHPGLEPDLTLLLDAPTEVGSGRAERRGAADRMENEAAAFHARVREGYRALAARYPERIRVIDATQPLADVQAAIARAVAPLLNAK